MKAGRWLASFALLLALILLVLMIARTWVFNRAAESALRPYGVTVTLHGRLDFSLLDKTLTLNDLSFEVPGQSLAGHIDSVDIALDGWPSAEQVSAQRLALHKAAIELAGDSVDFEQLSVRNIFYDANNAIVTAVGVEMAGLVSNAYATSEVSSINLSDVQLDLNTLEVELHHLLVDDANIDVSGDLVSLDWLSIEDIFYSVRDAQLTIAALDISELVSDVYAASEISSIKVSAVQFNLGTLEVEFERLGLGSGTVKLEPAGMTWQGIQLSDVAVGRDFFNLAELSAEGVNASSLVLDEVLLALPALTVKSVSRSGDALAIATVDVSAPMLRVIRTASGEIVVPVPVFTDKPTEIAVSDAEPEPRAEPRNLPEIGRVTITDGTIHVQDAAVKPAFVATFNSTEFEILDISSEVVPVPWTLALKRGDAAQIKLGGVVLLQDPALHFTLFGDVKHMELPGLSGYTSSLIGYAIETGQFNTGLDFKVVQNRLDGEAKVRLVRPKFVVLDKELASAFNGKLKMPLPMALSLLEDSDGDIAIDLPVSGDLSSPDVSLSGLFEIFAAKALRAGATHYLKTAIFPQTTLLSLAEFVGGGMYDHLSAQPGVLFEAGIVELGDDSRLILDNVKKLMVKKPRVSLYICSIAVDTDGLDAASRMVVAEQREDTVRSYLLASETIEPKRIRDCLSRVDAEGKRGRVELGF